MEFRLLGPLEIVGADGSVVEIGPAKDRTLLAVLLLHVNETVSTERLVDELWGVVPPPSAVKLVQTYVSHLRRIVGDALETSPPGYALRVDPSQVDAQRFEALVRRAGDEPPTEAAVTLREALALWRGDAAQGLVFEAFAAHEVAQLEDGRLDAVARRIGADLALGRHEDVVSELRVLVGRHPYRERFAEQLMLALYRCSRQTEALEVYRELRRRLADDLGLEPGEPLRVLEADILRQAPSLAPPARARARRGPRRRYAFVVAAAAIAVAVVAIAARVGSSRSPAPRLARQSLGLVDPGSGRLVRQVHLGFSSRTVAAAGGFVWAANYDGETLSRFPESGGTVVTIPVGGHPLAIAPTAGGAWVLEVEHRLAFVDNRFARRTRVRATAATQLAVGGARIWTSAGGALVQSRHLNGEPDGPPFLPQLGATLLAPTTQTLWTASGQWVTPLDPQTHLSIAPIHVPDPCVALGARGGDVWCLTAGPAQRNLIAIDGRRDLPMQSYQLGSRPVGLAVAVDGSAWVASATGVTSWTRRGRGQTVDLGVRLTAIAAGPRGIWVAS